MIIYLYLYLYSKSGPNIDDTDKLAEGLQAGVSDSKCYQVPKVVLLPESFEEGINVKNYCTLKLPKVNRIGAVLSLVRVLASQAMTVSGSLRNC